MSITDTDSWDVQAALYNSSGNALTGTITIDAVFTLTSSNKIYLGAGGVIEGNNHTITYDTGSNITGMFEFHDATCEVRNLKVVGPESGDSTRIGDSHGVFSSQTSGCTGKITGCEVSNLYLGRSSGGLILRGQGMTISRCVVKPKADGDSGLSGGICGTFTSGTNLVEDCEIGIEHDSGTTIYQGIANSVTGGTLNVNRCMITVPSHGRFYGIASQTTSLVTAINVTKTAVVGSLTIGGGMFGNSIYGGTFNLTDCYVSSGTIPTGAGGIFYSTRPTANGDVTINLTRVHVAGATSGSARSLIRGVVSDPHHTTRLTLDEVYVDDNTRLYDGTDIIVTGSATDIASSDIDGGLPSNGNWDAAWTAGT